MRQGDHRPFAGSFPTRRAYALLALGMMLFAIYLSLTPFAFRAVPFDRAVERAALDAQRPVSLAEGGAIE